MGGGKNRDGEFAVGVSGQSPAPFCRNAQFTPSLFRQFFGYLFYRSRNLEIDNI